MFLFGNLDKLRRSIAFLLTSTLDSRRPATELVSKCISKKVTKYLLLLNTFAENF